MILEIGHREWLVDVHVALLGDCLGGPLFPFDEVQLEQFLHRTLHGGSIFSQGLPDPLATLPATSIFDKMQENVRFELVET